MGDATGGGIRGQTPWRHPGGGGYDGTNTLAASPGGGMGQTPWRHPLGGGGDGTNTLVLPHYPTPRKSVNPAWGKGGEG